MTKREKTLLKILGWLIAIPVIFGIITMTPEARSELIVLLFILSPFILAVVIGYIVMQWMLSSIRKNKAAIKYYENRDG